jgi:hypothetical protein
MASIDVSYTVTIDENCGMAYIRFSDAPVAFSRPSEDEMFVYDFDASKNLVGVEVIALEQLLERCDHRPITTLRNNFATASNILPFMIAPCQDPAHV